MKLSQNGNWDVSLSTTVPQNGETNKTDLHTDLPNFVSIKRQKSTLQSHVFFHTYFESAGIVYMNY